MPAPADPMRLLPPAARAELDRHPLTPTEAAQYEDGPLGPIAGWYWCGAGCGLLALILHELTGLPLVGANRTLRDRDRGAGEPPMEILLEAGVARGAHVLGACGWRGAAGGERLSGMSVERLRALCAQGGGPDPDDLPTAAAAIAAARLLLERVGDIPA
jgi:hypothetical protein